MSPEKVAEYSNDDCYFFMYVECTKGASCLYRHSAAAKASSTICRYWWNGLCMRRDCKFRHIENKVTLRKRNEYKKEAEARMYPLYDGTKVDEYMEEHNTRVNQTEDIGDDREKERRIIAKMIEISYERYKPYEFRPQFIKKNAKIENKK